jgi:hypothetical protein
MPYLTVADELLEYADVARAYFREKGYTVRIEPEDLSFPFTPTFTARMQHTTLICELQGRLDLDRITAWVQYGRTCPRDTRIVLILTDSATVKSKDEQKLVELGVGVLICNTRDCYERLGGKDQALMYALPPQKALPPRVRRMLAPAYVQFDRGDWREGFKTACQIFEIEARTYLRKALSVGKVQLITKTGKVSKVQPETIDKATQGQLAEYYGMIASPNKTEAFLEQALKRLNGDRVRAIHHGRMRGTETRLRKNVGQNMLVIVNALDNLYK